MALDCWTEPLREDELHSRITAAGFAFDCDVTWINAPALDSVGTETVEAFPVLLPSNLVSRYGSVHRQFFYN